MKRIRLILAAIAIIALAGCLMFACSDGSGGGGGGDSFINGWEGQGGKSSGGGSGGPPPPAPGPTTLVDLLAIPGLVAPVAGDEPIGNIGTNAQYTGTVAWANAAGTALTGNFGENTVYVATITLAAKQGRVFEDDEGNTAGTFSLADINPSDITTIAQEIVDSTHMTVTTTFGTTSTYPELGIRLAPVVYDDGTGIGTIRITTDNGTGGRITNKVPGDFTFSGATIMPTTMLASFSSSITQTAANSGIFNLLIPVGITSPMSDNELTITLAGVGSAATSPNLKRSAGGAIGLAVTASNGTLTASGSGGTISPSKYTWAGITGNTSDTLTYTAAGNEYTLGEEITCTVLEANDYVISTATKVEQKTKVYKVVPNDVSSSGTGSVGTSNIAEGFGQVGDDINITCVLGDAVLGTPNKTTDPATASTGNLSLVYTILQADADAATSGTITVTFSWED